MTDSLAPVTGQIPLRRGPRVTAVVVTRGPTRYLGTTLRALADQSRPPDAVLVVDAKAPSTDDSAVDPARVDDLVQATLGGADAQPRTVPAPGARTFGDAVRTALGAPAASPATAPATGTATGTPVDADDAAAAWLWLLHDDSAPAPDALAELVRVIEHAPSVAVAGVKQRGWYTPDRLLEVGLTTSRLGRRVTGVEDGEVDQGQHDGREDVLAVGLAGALVRHDVWDELGGPDPALGPFGDGLDLCRRARLAGHRVVVVPRAVVRHARASYAGLRDDDLLHVLTGAAVHDPHPHVAPDAAGGPPPHDHRRSFATRRRAHVHAQLAAVPLPLLPVLTVVFLIAAALRSLYRVATKDAVLATAELAAPVVAVLNPARMARSRALARSTRRLPRRSLRPLQASWRDVLREERDRVLARREASRVRQAPSELELAELDALATRRRLGFAALGVALVALTVARLGPLIAAAVGGQWLVGGGLLPAGADLGEVWRIVTSGWVPGGLGYPGPADPLLTLLVPVTALTGGSAQAAVAVLHLTGLLVAGAGAWFAAGAATRSVGLRWWAAVVWVAVPALHQALDEGRLGAVVAHAALPWVALGVARALGVHRRDVVASGLVGARSPHDDDAPDDAPDAGPDDRAARTAADADEHPVEAPVARGATALAVPDPTRPPPVPGVPPRDPSRARAGSITAAAAGGLAFAASVAGAPVLLPAGLLVLLAVAVVARAHRWRLVLVALPALVVAGPLVQDALSRWDAGGWRALLAEPGLPVASTAGPAWQALLALPTPPGDRGAGLARWVGDDLAAVLPYVLGAVLVLLALLALLRGAPVTRGVRVGWLTAVCGLGAAVVAGRVGTAVVGGEVVRGWPGAGVSLAVLGLLAAAVLGADGVRARVVPHVFGRRQVAAGALAVAAALAPLAPLAAWFGAAPSVGTPDGDGPVAVSGVRAPVVPAVGRQAQTSEARSRVLALAAADDGGVAFTLLRGDGPQLTDRSAAVRARDLTGGGGRPEVVDPAADTATREVERLVARLASGAVGDVSADLARLAVGAVLVPPAPQPSTGTTTAADPDADAAPAAARGELVGRLDATAGLERITESETGVIWRVVTPAAPAAGAAPDEDGPDDAAPDDAGPADADGADPGAAATPVTAWARLVEPGSEATALPAQTLVVETRVPSGADGRTVVLAERADPGWRATLDGRRLTAAPDGWRQAWQLGASGGELRIAYAPTDQRVWSVVQAVVLGLTALLALPLRRRRGGAR